MMTREIPFAGHPSLGAAAAVARVRGEDERHLHAGDRRGAASRRRRGRRQRRRTSRCCRSRRRSARSSIPARCSAAVGLDADDAHPELPCQAVSTGLLPRARARPRRPGLAAPRVAGLRPHRAAARAARRRSACTSSRVDAEAGTRAGALVRRRAPRRARIRPPGRAAGPLCAYLAAAHRRAAGSTITQGVEMGRASRLVAGWRATACASAATSSSVVDGSVFLDG